MPSRAEATAARRQEILDAALACFSTIGYERTTLADIKARAGASTGSVYHHFASKEQLAATLYLEALVDTQESGLRALLRARTGAAGITAQVRSYIDWVAANPDRARFLLAMRHAPFLEGDEPTIDRLNTEVRDQTARWFAERVAAGELPDVDPAIRRAIVFGPCRHWAGSWLHSGKPSPATAKRLLAPAAVAALDALR